LFTTTLYNLGWVISEVIVPASKGVESKVITISREAEIEYTDNEKANIALIQSDSIVNPAFPKEEYEEAKATLPPDQFAMQYRGRAVRPRHMIYDCFDEERHLVERWTIPYEWPRYLGLDFGGANLFGLYFAVEPGTGRIHIYREYHAGGKSAAQHVSDLMDGEPGRPITYGGAGNEEQWRKEFREGGLPVRKPKVAEVWLGINNCYSVFKAGAPDDKGVPIGATEIFVFDDLDIFRKQIISYRRKTDEQGNPLPEEIVAKNMFHAMDAMRYCLPAIAKRRTYLIATV
jgi:hypothetical protein